MCVVFYAHACLSTMCVLVPMEARGGHLSPVAGVTDGSEPSHECWALTWQV